MKLGVYNINGRLVRVLAADVLVEGRRTVTWDGRDESGQLCPPGVYVISLQIGTRARSVKAVITRNEVGMTPGGSTR
jgi:flagellar hook assembly protein FlgD